MAYIISTWENELRYYLHNIFTIHENSHRSEQRVWTTSFNRAAIYDYTKRDIVEFATLGFEWHLERNKELLLIYVTRDRSSLAPSLNILLP